MQSVGSISDWSGSRWYNLCMVFDIYVQSVAHSMVSAIPSLGVAARAVSTVGAPAVLLAATACIVLSYLYKRELRLAAVWFLMGLLSSVTVVGAKSLFSRIRPEAGLLPLSDPSFPSGHALMSAAFFALLCYFWVRRNARHSEGSVIPYVVCIAASLIIGLSRILLGVHWATDVIAGWGIGIALTTLSVFLAKKRE